MTAARNMDMQHVVLSRLDRATIAAHPERQPAGCVHGVTDVYADGPLGFHGPDGHYGYITPDGDQVVWDDVERSAPAYADALTAQLLAAR
jgi:hypothetical protein